MYYCHYTHINCTLIGIKCYLVRNWSELGRVARARLSLTGAAGGRLIGVHGVKPAGEGRGIPGLTGVRGDGGGHLIRDGDDSSNETGILPSSITLSRLTGLIGVRGAGGHLIVRRYFF